MRSLGFSFAPRFDSRTSNMILSVCSIIWLRRTIVGINNFFVCWMWPAQCLLWSRWSFPTWVMLLLVDIMLYRSTYLGCQVGSFHLGVSHQLHLTHLIAIRFVNGNHFVQVNILFTKDTIYFCKLMLIYSLTPSFVW